MLYSKEQKAKVNTLFSRYAIFKNHNVFKQSRSNKTMEKNSEKEEIKINIGKAGKVFKKIPRHNWAIATYILGIICIILIISSTTGYSLSNKTINKKNMESLVDNFVNTKIVPTGGAIIQNLEEKSGVYVAIVSYDGNIIPLYFTKDGNFISQGGKLIPINKIENDTDITSDTFNVSADDDAVKGNANAPVTIIEFSDFQCPFCGKFYKEAYSQIVKNYIDTGKVKLVFRDFPLIQIHPQAQKSAEAAECVRSKGGDTAFFKMHDKIFENQETLSEDNLKKWAKELGYNIDTCLNSGEKESEVLKDLSDGQDAGVSGTPSFFINGIPLEGAQPYSNFEEIIKAELAK